MFDDYYSFHPQINLKKSICVVGFFGTPLAQSVRFMQAISGLPVQDVERLLEHRLGTRLAHYLRGHHKEDLWKVEYDILQSSLSEQPSVIALRPSTLRYKRSRELLSRLDGVVLMQSVSTLHTLLDIIHHDDRRERFHDLDLTLPLTENQIHAERTVWKRYLPKAWQSLSTEETTPSALGQHLWEHLQLVG